MSPKYQMMLAVNAAASNINNRTDEVIIKEECCDDKLSY